MRRLHLVVALAGLGLSGCWDLDFRYDNRGVREDTGPVVVGSAAAAVAFSADGSELFYGAVRPDQPSSARVELRAVRLADGLERVIDERPVDDLLAITALPDGSAIYYLAVVDGHFRLREALSATDVALDGAPQGGVIAFSRDLEKLYLGTQEHGTVVLDRGTGVAFEMPCRGRAGAAFSPAGDELVCQRNDQESTAIIRIRLADQVQTPLPGVEGCPWAEAFRWNADGISIACQNGVVGDPESGARLASVHEWTNDVHLAFTADERPGLEFTADQRALVMAETECLAGDLFSCSRLEYRLQVLDLATRHRTFIASSAGGLGSFDVSPDGTAIAYTFADPSSYMGMRAAFAVHLRPIAR